MRHPLPPAGPGRPAPAAARALVVGLVALLALLGSTGAAHASAWESSAERGGAARTQATLDEFEDQLLEEVNRVRRLNDRKRIRSYDSCADRLAEVWGAHLALTGVLEHRDQNEVLRLCDVTWSAETLVRGTGLTPQLMVQAWMDSPSHRVILLHRKAHRAGVAVTTDLQGRLVGVLNVVRAD